MMVGKSCEGINGIGFEGFDCQVFLMRISQKDGKKPPRVGSNFI